MGNGKGSLKTHLTMFSGCLSCKQKYDWADYPQMIRLTMFSIFRLPLMLMLSP